MQYLTVVLTVRDAADVPVVRDLLASAMRLSRKEAGCLRFDIYQSEADQRRFTLVEHWESPAALEAHRQAEAYTTIYKPRVMPLVEREGHPSSLLE